MNSLKSRLIGAATIWIALGIVTAGFVLSAVFRKHVTEQFYEELYTHLDELKRLAEVSPSGARLQRNLSDPRYDVAKSGYYWEIQDTKSVLARSDSLEGDMLQSPPDAIKDTSVHTHKITGPTGPLLIAEKLIQTTPSDPPFRYIIGTDQRHLDAVLQNFNTTLAWSLSGFGLSMVVAASLLILFAMRPLVQLRSSLSAFRLGQTKALNGAFPTEVQPLVDDLNALLDSTTELIQRARTQAGNIAHSLKTPLAILTDEAYRIEAKGLSQSATTVLDQCSKMQTQIDYQIARARAVAMRSTPGTVSSAGQSSEEITTALSRLHRAIPVAIENSVPRTLLVACDAQDVNEMLANLVDNACKHAKSVVRIAAISHASDGLVGLTVDDDGPGLPPEAFDLVFNIGERWDSQVAGSGLGLAIVRDLARLYGGDVKLSPSSLGGLSVLLELPRAQE